MKIEWLPSALDDLRRQLDYISLRNPRAALRCSERVEAAVSRLAAHPLSGRAGRRVGTRELVVSRTPYIVIYRLEGGGVVILTLLHGAQDWPGSP